MDIRKSKVEKNREWSANTQKVLASFLGVSAVSMFAACDLMTTSGDVTVPDSSDSTYIPSGDVVDPDEIRLSSSSPSPESSSSSPSLESSSSQPRSSSSRGPVGGISSSSFYPPLAGIVMPESSSSSYPVDSLEISSGEIVPPVESSSSSSPYYANSSSGILVVLSSSSFEAPPQSSSSEEPEPLAGDPIEPPPPPLAGVIEDQSEE